MPLEALLPPKPRWRPLPAVGPQTPEVRPVPLEGRANDATRERLDKVRKGAAALFPNGRLVELTWLKVEDNCCVGMGWLLLDGGGVVPSHAQQVVIKQVDPLSALREIAWHEAFEGSGAGPKLMGRDKKDSLFVAKRVAGVHLFPGHFTPEHHKWVMQALALFHAIDLPKGLERLISERPFPPWRVAPWLHDLTHNLEAKNEKKFRMPERTCARLSALLNRIEAKLKDMTVELTCIHGDLHENNILIDIDGRRAALIDFEYGVKGDPMFDLAFFAISLHLPMQQALALLEPYEEAWKRLGCVSHANSADRLALYVTYQRLFRHVASHNEYVPGGDNDYDRWLSRLHDDVAVLVQKNLVLSSIELP